MTVRVFASFERSLASLSPGDRQATEDALDQLLRFIGEGRRPQGLGFRKLQDRFWEIRVDLRQRVLVEMEGDVLSLVLVGSHDDIRRALRRR